MGSSTIKLPYYGFVGVFIVGMIFSYTDCTSYFQYSIISGGDHVCSCFIGNRPVDSNQCNYVDWNLVYSTKKDVDYIAYPQGTKSRITKLKNAMYEFLASDAAHSIIYMSFYGVWEKYVAKIPLIDNSGSTTGDADRHQKLITKNIGVPEGISYDYITNNIYFADSEKRYIAVCVPTEAVICSVIVQDAKFVPKNIALVPSKGLMFWTDWGKIGGIIKSRMDGSELIVVLEYAYTYYPLGITADEHDERIYWVEANYGSLHSANYDFKHIRNIKRVFGNPFEIDIYKDRVFWSDRIKNKIFSANKYNGEEERIEVYNSSDTYLSAITLMSRMKHPKFEVNPCENMKCSHICSLSGNDTRCVCPSQMKLYGQHECVEDENIPKIMVAIQDKVYIRREGTVGMDIYQSISLPSVIYEASALLYNPLDDSLIISDPVLRKILQYHMKSKRLNILVTDGIIHITSMAIDVIGENLLFLDAGKGTIELMSLRTLAIATVFEGLSNVHDMAFDMTRFKIHISSTSDNGTGQVRVISLQQGVATSKLNEYEQLKAPIRLSYCSKSGVVVKTTFIDDQIFVYFGEHLKIRHDTTNFENLIKFNDDIFVFGKASNKIEVIRNISYPKLKAEPENTNILRPTYKLSKHIPIVLSTMHYEIKNFKKMRTDHECSPAKQNRRKCSHICLGTGMANNGLCWCPNGFHLEPDGLTCKETENFDILPTREEFFNDHAIESVCKGMIIVILLVIVFVLCTKCYKCYYSRSA